MKLNARQIAVILIASAVPLGITIKHEFLGGGSVPRWMPYLTMVILVVGVYLFRTKPNPN